MQRILICIVIVFHVFNGIYIFSHREEFKAEAARDRLCPQLVGSEGTAAGNLFDQLCTGRF